MDKIKRFIDCKIPVTTCNLRCHYCYITHHSLFKVTPFKMSYSPQHVRKALSKERMGGICMINLCGDGETLLVKDIIQYIRELLEEGHYLMVVTNGTITQRFEEISNFPQHLFERLFFKFSFHYLELKEKNLLNKFFNNVCLMRDAGCSFTIETTPSDELIPFIDEMKECCIKNVGAWCHVTVARDEHNPRKLPILTKMTRDNYETIWNSLDSSFFKYKFGIFGKKRHEFCYAGDWSFTLNLGTGEMKQCYKSLISQNIFKNLDSSIKFKPIGCHCLQEHCYNGHAFLAFGDIPELDAPTFASLRNRICNDGKEWLNPKMKLFMSSKLYETNRILSLTEKRKINLYLLPNYYFAKTKASIANIIYPLRKWLKK